MSGLFISIEGMDGVGKSTQTKLLQKYLSSLGFEVVSTRDPGGTIISDKIRDILLDKNNNDISYITETLLYSASRSQLVKQTILPSLKKGAIVICDRFIDSNLAYQGVAREVGIENIEIINKIALDGLTPDITFFLSLPPEVAFYRKKAQGHLDRIEVQKLSFYKKVHSGYIQVAKKYPDRIYIINASRKVKQIHKDIVGILNNLFLQKGFHF